METEICSFCGQEIGVEGLAPFTLVECPLCKAQTRAKTQMGSFELIHKLGIGGMSFVFLARDPTLERQVAVKILNQTYCSDEARVANFTKEAQITALISHPNVVRVFTVGEAYGYFYIVMELVEGGSLEERIVREGIVSEQIVLPLAIEVAEGLSKAYRAGLLHRDMKPANILFDSEGHAKIVDFGLSLLIDEQSVEKEIWATPHYVSPETLRREPEDFRSDMYSLGATLYHALFGQAPCRANTTSVSKILELKTQVVPLKKASPFVSEKTAEIIDKLMAFEPSDRFSSYHELIDELKKALKSLSEETSGTSLLVQEKRPRRIFGFLTASIFLILLAMSGFWFFLQQKQAEILDEIEAQKPAPKVVPEAGFLNAGPQIIKGQEIAEKYSEAHASLFSGNFPLSIEQFDALFSLSETPIETAVLVKMESVLAAWLQGDEKTAETKLNELEAFFAKNPPKSDTLSAEVFKFLGDLKKAKIVDFKSFAKKQNSRFPLANFTFGVKNWQLRKFEQARPFFEEFRAQPVPEGKAWIRSYQLIVDQFLKEEDLFSNFAKFPESSIEEVKAKIDHLRKIQGQISTGSIAKNYISKQQQRLLARQESLEAVARQSAAEFDPLAPRPQSKTESLDILDRAENLASLAQFKAAAELAKSCQSTNEELLARRDSLAEISQSAAEFFNDIAATLKNQSFIGLIKATDGRQFVKISATETKGEFSLTDKSGQHFAILLDQIAPESLQIIHQARVATLSSEEKKSRHIRATSFFWLIGQKEKASNAAKVLGNSDPNFSATWQQWMENLKKN